MDTNSDSYSLHSLSIPPSLRSATKEKFDNLLKTALKHKKSTSKEKLIDDIESTTASSENLLDNGDNIQSTNIDEESNKTFLLNKFLGDSSIRINENQDSSVFKIPPVPKPRKLKNIEQRRSSNSSAHTFNVTSPKIIKNAESISSSVTYIVENEQKAKANLKEVGDVVLHNSPTISKVCVYAENRENLEKNDDSISDCNSSSSNIASFIRNSQKIDTEKTKNENIELNILSSNTDSNNEFSINKKPKPRQRLNKSKAAIVNTLPIEETVKKDSSSDVQIIEEELQPQNPYNYKDITEIIIHKSDRLKLNTFVLHPVVKLHIVDIKTGEYYKKSDKKRSVVFYYESDTSYILPVMTSYYNLQEKRSFFPCWEETILLNEDFDYLITENVILFFEILDFASVSIKASNYSINTKSDKGWFRIAFAFLKPIGKNNFSNANKKVRLQLYYPGHMSTTKHNINKCYVWDWWHKQKLKKYPSTLYVTVRKIISPKKIIQAVRSKTPLQHEHISSEIVDDNDKNKVVEKEPNHRTITISDTKYKVPNKCTAELDSYDEGCFLLKFSNSGEYLACVVKIDDEFSILIYETKYFQEFTKFTSHHGLIYSLNWSHNDSLLLSASADNTVAVWNFDKKNCFQILPHPTFVYASDINMENTIATGCYDKMIRIWSQTCKSRNFKLSQELGSHEGYVTSICFSRKITDTLFSADSVGKIIQWNMVEGEWKHYRNINILELNGIIINQILLFPNEKRMLVHARDSSLRIISINNCYVLHWLHGALNTRVQTYCSLSNNGHYVFCGSENGFVVVWNAKTGKDIHTYSIYQTTVHCVQLHPKENMFAVSHYGSKLPILVYSYCNSDNSIEKPVEDENALQITRNMTTKFRKTYGNERNLDFHEILEKMDKMLHL